MATAFRSVLTFRDIKGKTARCSWYSFGADPPAVYGSAANVGLMAQIISVASAQAQTGPAQFPPLGLAYGSAGDYDSVEDKAVFHFATFAGERVSIEIPCPATGVFLNDRETVNKLNGDVANFISAMLDGTTCDRAGGILQAYLGGLRKRRRTQLRNSLYLKAADLSTPAL